MYLSIGYVINDLFKQFEMNIILTCAYKNTIRVECGIMGPTSDKVAYAF